METKKSRRQLSTNIDFEIRSPLVKNIVLAVCIVGLLSFSAYQLIMFRTQVAELTTQTALAQTVSRTVTAQSFFVRQEEYLPSVGAGTVVPKYENGSKVGIGDTVAMCFSSADSAQNAAHITTLENEIEYYEGISALNYSSLQAGVKLYDSNVVNSILGIQQCIAENNLKDLSSALFSFSEGLTKKQISIGGSADVSGKLESLKTELMQIQSSTSAYTAVSASKAGYYVNEIDGYENTADYSEIKNISSAQIDSLLASAPVLNAGSIGKLITDFNWYMVCNVTQTEAEALTVGDTVTVGLASYSQGKIKMKLCSKNDGEGDKIALVFSSNVMNAELAALRKAIVQIRLEEYSGLAVDKKAVRTVNGENGVYVQLGSIVRFRKINIIYSDENIIIVNAPESESGYLQLYDEIITEGTDLYDGKIIT